MVVGLCISSGIMLNCGNISSEEPEPEGEPVPVPTICFVDFELEARISDTLLAREQRASESMLAKAFRLKI